ncbi:flavin-containing monooxygenase [Nocardia alni]|uniref:flavin-containing monooxygenase n=1 Tax=Nocardia alni TaxID=2815723 RepID=UPI001C2352F5|nr:NAD(P)/FAD-dependent oxidoreductase [Nocardia alni]
MPDNIATSTDEPLDALVVGAGISGLYQLYALRTAGLKVRLLEAGSGVGGTWFWNRYPGARFDSESYTYAYFFPRELVNEWTWSEEFAGQPETERYLNFVADRLDLRRDIQLETRVTGARWSEAERLWTVTTEHGATVRTRFLITALGILSKPAFPNVPGREDFKGEWYHTGLWPHTNVEFTGKRVAVIGTGSSGVQIVPFVAKDASSLTIFQRTPNWCTPINNFAITPEYAQQLRDDVDKIYELCRTSPGGSKHRPMMTSSLDLTDEQRREHFDRLYQAPGLSMALANFRDIALDRTANANLTAYIAEKIRARVDDPAVAEKLIPTDHGFGQKRPPLENGYYEVFNQPHVELISLADEPMVRITETGIETTKGHYELDMIIFGTGFEAVTGSYRAIDIRGIDDRPLLDHWDNGPRTYLGLQAEGFPNLFFVGGPQSTAGNIPRFTEVQADWVTRCIAHLTAQGHTRIGTSAAAEEEWNEHVLSGIRGTLQETAESWSFGSNVEGRKRAYLLYAGGLPTYRDKITEAESADYKGFELS